MKFNVGVMILFAAILITALAVTVHAESEETTNEAAGLISQAHKHDD